MPNPIPPRRLTLAFTLACLCIFGAQAVAAARTPQRRRVARARAAACATVTDADIVTAIQEKIKADARYTGQWTHINVSSKGHVVTLEGWAAGKGAVARLVSYARTTRCVVRVKNRLRAYRTVGCGPGQKPCGDGCVDRDSDCNAMQPE